MKDKDDSPKLYAWIVVLGIFVIMCLAALLFASIKIYDDHKAYVQLNASNDWNYHHNITVNSPGTCSLGVHGNYSISNVAFFLLSDQGCDFLEYSCNNSMKRYAVNCTWRPEMNRCDCYMK